MGVDFVNSLIKKYREDLYEHTEQLTADQLKLLFRDINRWASSYCGRGAGRTVFHVNKSLVLKVPRHTGAIEQNKTEHLRYQNQLDFPMAPCRLIRDSKSLLMQKVDPVSVANTALPDWASKVDGGQVGRLNGKLLAFDYANRVPTYT